MLRGIDNVRDIRSTIRCNSRAGSVNNALLWGARGMGKSSLVKALHGHINDLGEPGLKRPS